MYKDPMSQADMEYKRYKVLNPVEADDRRTADKTHTDDTSTEDNLRGVASAEPEPKDQAR